MNDKEKCCARRKTSIGGQALMEGIMMRGPVKNAMAVRRANGEIFFEENLNDMHPGFFVFWMQNGVSNHGKKEENAPVCKCPENL